MASSRTTSIPVMLAVVIALPVGFAVPAPGGTDPVSASCGDILTSDTVLAQDLVCAAGGLRVGGDGITLDCAGHAILGNGPAAGDGVVVTGARDVTIKGCRISGFSRAVRGEDAVNLRVAGSVLAGNASGIRCAGCDGVSIEGNRIEGHLGQIHITHAADARIVDNRFVPHAKGGGITLRYAPRAWIAGNRAPAGGASMLIDGSEGIVVEANEAGGNATLSLWSSDRCRILHNVLTRGNVPGAFGGSVRVQGSRECLVKDNRIEGLYGIDVSGAPAPPGPRPPEADEHHVIEDNDSQATALGLIVFGTSGSRIAGNRIRTGDGGLGLGLLAVTDAAAGFVSPCAKNVVESNAIGGAGYGTATWLASANLFVRNELAGNVVGAFEGPQSPLSPGPNSYVENTITGNGFFGIIAGGGSPRLEGNLIAGNGGAEAPGQDAEPYLSLLGGARGGVALIPYAGDDFVLDNGNPGDDFLAMPVVGGPSAKNLFEANTGIDLYALDTRAANEATLQRDNQFKGRGSIRIRQDWYGLVRAVDPAGDPIENAEVEVRDAGATIVARMTTDSSGLAPGGADPLRPQGRSPFEDEGPAPTWPIFTEYVVDSRGRRVDLTPHAIAAASGDGRGCAVYSWNGLPDGPPGTRAADGRYQIAVVRPGDPCPEAAARTTPGSSSPGSPWQ